MFHVIVYLYPSQFNLQCNVIVRFSLYTLWIYYIAPNENLLYTLWIYYIAPNENLW